MHGVMDEALVRLHSEIEAKVAARNGEVVGRVIAFCEDPSNWVSDFPDIDRDYTPTVAKYLREQSGGSRCRYMRLADEAMALDRQLDRHRSKIHWSKEWEVRGDDLVARRWRAWSRLVARDYGLPCGRCYQCFGITGSGKSLATYVREIEEYFAAIKRGDDEALARMIDEYFAGSADDRCPDSGPPEEGQREGSGESPKETRQDRDDLGRGGWYLS